jgi:hypothetical protein
MQIAHGGGEHDQITWGQMIPEDQLALHGKKSCARNWE